MHKSQISAFLNSLLLVAIRQKILIPITRQILKIGSANQPGQASILSISLSKTLNPKLLPMSRPVIAVCVFRWMTPIVNSFVH